MNFSLTVILVDQKFLQEQNLYLGHHRAECGTIIIYSESVKRQILMWVGHEKLIIREENWSSSADETCSPAFQKLNTQARLFEKKKLYLQSNPREKTELEPGFSLWTWIACVANVSVQFGSKERGTRVKDCAKNGASKRLGRGWLSFHFSRGQNRSFFAPKPNGNACYAG